VSTGLIALLDDVAGIAKVAAASIDDVAAQAGKAGAKAAGVVIDDAAVTPRYLVGFAASRELPIVWRIALGSLKNKLVFLLPAALLLSFFAPWAITPLLMLGGAYLCYEGAEKVYEALWPNHAHGHEAKLGMASADPLALENAKVKAAIQTDFILSAEIMAITLATLPQSSFWMQAVVLAVVGIGITAIVYGGVAIIVKADDLGVAMATGRAAPLRAIGRGLVLGMPVLLRLLSILGTAAMIWVGGGILIHGLEEFGWGFLGHLSHDLAAAAGHAVPEGLAGAVEWLVAAAIAGVVGLAVGAALIPLVEHLAAPLVRRLRGATDGGAAAAAEAQRAH
jgi:predicted DNA repair protein MutK